MKLAVIGSGRWGTFIAWYLCRIGHDVTLFGRQGSKSFESLVKTRRNSLLELPDELAMTDDISRLRDFDTVIISVGSQSLRELMEQIRALGDVRRDYILCMKGIECGTGLRLSEVVSEYVSPSSGIAVWVGPGHVQEFASGIPNCMVIDSENTELKRRLVDSFSSDLIRFYYGTDLIGSEIGAAAKNVIGIAAGMLDGLRLSTLKGALMSRGTREIARLIAAMGGNELSAYGLCHLGDYEATVFSEFSHNRMFGEMLVRGETYDSLAEGYYTVDALMLLREKYSVELPICESVWRCLYRGEDPRDSLTTLFTRSIKHEI